MKSRPLSIWIKNNIWTYIKEYDIDVNPAYNFDKSKSLSQQQLRFDRLGCTSCPYGSFIEQRKIQTILKIILMINHIEQWIDLKNYCMNTKICIIVKDS